MLGDMYFMGLSATRFLKHWPDLLKEYKKISLHNCWMETFKHSGEIMIPPKKVADRLRDVGLDPDTPPGEFQMRPLVYKMFVSAVERHGVSVQFNRKIVDYYENDETGKAGCTAEDGQTYEADVIIAADGVGSKSQKLVGGQVRATPSGRAMWRAAFPREALEANPKVKEFFKMQPGNEPIVRTWLGPSTYALTLTREDVMVWIMNHDVRVTTHTMPAQLTRPGHRNRERELEQHHRQERGARGHGQDARHGKAQVGAHLQGARRSHASKHDRQLRASLA